MVVGQILTAVIAVGLLIGNGYPLVQMLIVCTAVCFGFSFCNPPLSSAASKAAGRAMMGGALGVAQGVGLLGQVGV